MSNAANVPEILEAFKRAAHAEHASPEFDENDEFIELLAELPDDIPSQYGIDLH